MHVCVKLHMFIYQKRGENMAKRIKNPNAAKALEDLKMEIAQDLGLENNMNTPNDPVNNIFTAGAVGGLMTRRLVEMGEEELIKKDE